MKKGFIKLKNMGDYEKEQGRASYRTVVNRYIKDIVLCNNITNIDYSVFDNMNENFTENTEVFQWYLCNLTEWDKEEATKCGLILSYSDELDCDILCVDHWGTSWDYVLTDVKLFDNWEDLEKYESEED